VATILLLWRFSDETGCFDSRSRAWVGRSMCFGERSSGNGLQPGRRLPGTCDHVLRSGTRAILGLLCTGTSTIHRVLRRSGSRLLPRPRRRATAIRLSGAASKKLLPRTARRVVVARCGAKVPSHRNAQRGCDLSWAIKPLMGEQPLFAQFKF
jgi:hypothetical protein